LRSIGSCSYMLRIFSSYNNWIRDLFVLDSWSHGLPGFWKQGVAVIWNLTSELGTEHDINIADR